MLPLQDAVVLVVSTAGILACGVFPNPLLTAIRQVLG